jgi:hypothetical protein
MKCYFSVAYLFVSAFIILLRYRDKVSKRSDIEIMPPCQAPTSVRTLFFTLVSDDCSVPLCSAAACSALSVSVSVCCVVVLQSQQQAACTAICTDSDCSLLPLTQKAHTLTHSQHREAHHKSTKFYLPLSLSIPLLLIHSSTPTTCINRRWRRLLLDHWKSASNF